MLCVVTSVNAWELFSEVDKCWQFGHSVFSSISGIIDLDERYVQVVSFLVNFFQALKNVGAGLAVIRIEVDGDKVVFLEELLQHFSVDLLDLIASAKHLLRRQPLQDGLLVGEVALEGDGVLLSEVDQCRSIVDVEMFGCCQVVIFHEIDPVQISLVVDVFQGLENDITFGAVLVI